MTSAGYARFQRHLDHELFEFRRLDEPSGLQLDSGVRVAVSVCIVLQGFGLEDPVPAGVAGALERPFPDIGSHSQRQVGLTDGLWRLVDAIAASDVPVSFIVDERSLVEVSGIHGVLKDPRHAVVAGGRHATAIHNAMSRDEEVAAVRDIIAAIHTTLGRSVTGWRSPYCAPSALTPEILAASGLRYTGDLANDDRPYRIATSAGPLVAVPMNHFNSDLHLIKQCRQTEAEFYDAIGRAADWLLEEATPASPAVLPVVLHPWLAGTPHRIAGFEALMSRLKARDGVAFLSSDAIVKAWKNGG
jgi:allantoinase